MNLTRQGRRRLIIAIVIIAVSIAIAAFGIPAIPPSPTPMGTLSAPVTGAVRAGNSNQPGFFALRLNGTQPNHGFIVQVSVTNSSTVVHFCILKDREYQSWRMEGASYAGFPFGDCAQNIPANQTSLSFTPTDSDVWDIVVLNTAQVGLSLEFNPS